MHCGSRGSNLNTQVQSLCFKNDVISEIRIIKSTLKQTSYINDTEACISIIMY